MICPDCGSGRLYKDGFRYLQDGVSVQRFLCRDCGYRFSNAHNHIKTCGGKHAASKYAVKQPKNLLALKALNQIGKTTTELAGATEKGQILQFLFELQKEGLAETSIKIYESYLRMLKEGGADLSDPETVKEVLAKRYWSANTRAIAGSAYTRFLGFTGGTWKPPKIRKIRKLPFIPLEKEIDALISGSQKKRAAFLQLLKETGLRSGEAWNLKWIDIDFIARTITFNNPEKHGNPRILRISPTLIAMLKTLQTDNPKIFTSKLRNFRQAYYKSRKRLALKLNNPRLLRITFHTFRHWKATMEYHKTKDILYVKQLLGHRDINTTLLYTQLVNFESDEYHTATAKTVEESRKLAEAGFEHFDTIGNVHIYRKRK